MKTKSKMSCHLESKSSGAFNFIGTISLELCTISNNLIIKKDAICDVTNQTPKMLRKVNTNGSHVIYVILYLKLSAMVLF